MQHGNKAPQFDILMTHAIQNAYYKQAKNPSDLATLLELAATLGLNINNFQACINSSATQKILLDEIKLARTLKVNSFPSIVLKKEQSSWLVPIDYNNEKSMLETIELITHFHL
ncbi:MAG: DsbA family protein [Pseudomonadota bacterium]